MPASEVAPTTPTRTVTGGRSGPSGVGAAAGAGGAAGAVGGAAGAGAAGVQARRSPAVSQRASQQEPGAMRHPLYTEDRRSGAPRPRREGAIVPPLQPPL